MFWRKIIFLAAWYVAGNVVASVYGKNKKTVKNVTSKEDIRSMIDNFLNTQKNFISDVEEKYVSEGNREKIAEKKAEFKVYAEKYQKQGKQLFEELQKNKEVSKTKANWFFLRFLIWMRNILSVADQKLDTVEKQIKKGDKRDKEDEETKQTKSTKQVKKDITVQQ